jgi:hypothetical protein
MLQYVLLKLAISVTASKNFFIDIAVYLGENSNDKNHSDLMFCTKPFSIASEHLYLCGFFSLLLILWKERLNSDGQQCH